MSSSMHNAFIAAESEQAVYIVMRAARLCIPVHAEWT